MPARSPAVLDRRRLILGAAAGSALAALRDPRHACSAILPREDGPALVLVQLTGGNDGLSTVVPHGDDTYHRSRRATRIGAEEVLRLDERVGLHPELRELYRAFDRGSLAIVQGCGHPEASRSHFRALEVWHAGDPRGRAAGAGWIGRACERAFGADARATRLVHVGAATPFSLASSRHPAASFVEPESYRWIAIEDEIGDYGAAVGARAGAPPRENDRLAFVRRVLADARASSHAVRAAAATYRPRTPYPDDPFARDLQAAAAVLSGDLGARVVSLELRGFDTHANQRAAHDRLMQRLDGGLGAFLRDLEADARGREAVVLVFSEFGRRVAENGSRGTDHGTAGPMLLAGARVRGGLFGEHPSLERLEHGDLTVTTDFRSVYAAVIEAVLAVPAADVLDAAALPLDLFV